MKILLSNGSNKFHLAPLASQLQQIGVLDGFITSGWPTKNAKLFARMFLRLSAVRRFIDREEEIHPKLIHASQFSELLFQVGIQLRRISENTEQKFDLIAFGLYNLKSKKTLSMLHPDIYHYRSCYGLDSVNYAKMLGIPTICDHSIAHPGVLQYMIENKGNWPSFPLKTYSSPLQKLMRNDIESADHIIVNSDFVKETCMFCGIDASRIHVVYLGVDDKFLHSIPKFDYEQVLSRSKAHWLFAGGIQRRKGAETLAEAYLSINGPAPIVLLAGIDNDLIRQPLVKNFLNHPTVTHYGIVARSELARQLTLSPIFVFPSYCEGSARVIFEAMACGCFIITTRNAGSIVKDGEHGLIVSSGDSAALAAALTRAQGQPEWVARVGWRNAQLIRERFLQKHYADNICSVYKQVLSEKHKSH